MLYTNRFIPHPLRPDPRQSGLRDPAAGGMIRAINATTRPRVMDNGASNQILPRTSMFDQQVKRTKKESKKSTYQLRRTTVTIDSAFRQQETSFVRTSLFRNVVSEDDIESYTVDFPNTDPTNDIEMVITVTFTSLSTYQKHRIEEDFDSNGCVFILENLPKWPKTRLGGQQNLFDGIPLFHLNYDSKTGYPFHKVITQTLETIDGKMTAKLTISLTKQAETIGVHYMVRVPVETDLSFTEINTYLTRVHDISMGYPYPQKYKMNLGYTFKNVVAVRLLNTVIPNVSFMINSSTRKNNKLRWINQCSKVTLPNVAVFKDGESITTKHKFYTDLHAQTYLTDTGDTLGQVYVHDISAGSGTEKHNPHTLTELASIVNMYAIKTITLHGGTYTPDSLATELEKELNRELVSSTASHEGFSEFSWYHGHFLPKPQSDDTFARGNSNPRSSRFFVSTNNKKRIISIQQCKSVYHSNNYRIETTQNRVVQEGPLYVNAGVPYLYVRLPGTTIQSGDSVRVAGAFDILNIRDTEINREHTAIVCSVRRYRFTVDMPNLTVNEEEEHPFTLYEIMYQENVGLSTFGRIIRVETVLSTSNQYDVWLEMMGEKAFKFSEKCIAQTSNVVCTIVKPDDDGNYTPVDNAHAGFNIKLAHVPTRTILTGIGTEQLFIGTPVAFKFLFGVDENPGEVLGFHKDKTGMNNESIEFKMVESNTVDIHKINVVESVILPTTQTEDYFSIEIKLSQECPYSVGDRVFMTNHMPNADIHTRLETFSFDFTSIEKGSGDTYTRLTLHRDSFQSKMCLFGKRPDTTTFTFIPFQVNDMVYIHDNEIEVPVYEKDVYIITLSTKETYKRGDIFEGSENAIVEETQYASNTFRVKRTNNNGFNFSESTEIIHIELARAQIDGQFRYRKQGIPDGVYKILNVDNDNGAYIEVDARWQNVRAEKDQLFQKGIGRANMPEIKDVVINIENGNLTLDFPGSNTMIDTFQENILYIYSTTIPGQYYRTIPDPESLKIKTLFSFADEDTVTVRVCSSSTNTILNDHNGFTISSVDTTKTKVTIQVPKSHLPIDINPVSEFEIAYKRHVDVDNQLKIPYGKFGQMFMKEVDKPYIVSDNFMYLKCPTLSTIKNTETNAVHDLFAKILLPGKTGSYVFDTFVATPKVFNEHPLRELHELAFHFVNKHGDTVDFNEMDHSIVLEIVEAVERLERLNVQMSQ